MNRKQKKRPFRLPRYITLLVLAAGASRAGAQSVDWFQSEQNPGWTYLTPRLKYLEYDMEYEKDNYTSPGNSVKTERYYLSPTAGIEWDNYIYHPDLLTYSFLFAPGYIWEKSGAPGAMSVSDQLALDGDFKVNLLQAKPYATTVDYDRSQQQIKYDFFNSATVNTESWGVSSGYREGPVPVIVSFEQSDVNSQEPGQTSDTTQTTFNLDAKNERNMDDRSELTYLFGQFNQETEVSGFSYNNNNIYHHLTLLDIEHYRKSILRSSLLFDYIEAPNSFSSSDVNATIDYEINHTPHFNTDYNYSLSQYSDSFSDSLQNAGSVTLHHQLYDSLTSSLEFQGTTVNSSSSGSTLDSYSGQITGSENYTKRLSDWGRLTTGESASYTYTDQETSGSQTVVPNESHVVPPTGLVILNQPLDTSISIITDSTGTIILQPGLDYTVNETTQPWQVQINSSGPSHILPGATILITYTVQSNPTGDYSVFANQSQIMLGFWNGLADVYVRYNLTQNQANSSEFVFQNENEFQAGADFNWRRLSVNGSYINDRSSLYDSQTYNLAESYSLVTTAHSRVGFNFGQQWADYSFNNATMMGNQNQHSTFYNFMLFCEWHPSAALSWNTEGGLQRTLGNALNNEDLFAVRSYVNWSVGKLEVHLGYEYDNQNYTTQTMNRNYAFIRIRRNF